MSAARIEALRARVLSVTPQCADVDSFSRSVCELIGAVVPFDFGCLATTDPTTKLITGAVKTAPDDLGDDEFAHYEYAVDDVNQFSEIACRQVPAGILSLDTGGRPETSARYRNFLLPHYGFSDELRVAFRSQSRTWGVLGLYRAGGGHFSRFEADALAAVSDTVALGIRRALFVTAAMRECCPDGPAVVVVNRINRIRQITPAGQRIAELGGMTRDTLPTCLLATITAARISAHISAARLRTKSGEWVLVRAARMRRADGEDLDLVLTIEAAGLARSHRLRWPHSA